MPLFVIRCAFAVAANIVEVRAVMATPTGKSIKTVHSARRGRIPHALYSCLACHFDDGFVDTIGNNPIPALDPITGLPVPCVDIVDGTRVEDSINELGTFGGRVFALWTPSDRFSLDFMALMQNIENSVLPQLG